MDGRTFDYEAESDSPVLVGDLLTLGSGDTTSLLLQIMTKERAKGRGVRGSGVVLGKREDGALSPSDARPFRSVAFSRADPKFLDLLVSRRGPTAHIGTMRTGGASALLSSSAFNRHTFLCGQSGSGMTYALGVILQQLLAETDLRIVILDPNGDFVRLGELRPDAVERCRFSSRSEGVRVFRPGSAGAEPRRVRWGELTRRTQAAVLQLDPIRDRGEFNVLLHLPPTDPLIGRAQLVKEIASLGRTVAPSPPDWRTSGFSTGLYGPLARPQCSRRSMSDRARQSSKIGSFDTPSERSAAAPAVLDHLWQRRESRDPTLIVIDEAHNVCTTEPADELQALTTERLVQIAGEGRKFGLWLLVSTQRPSKIHPNVLSQCDNLV